MKSLLVLLALAVAASCSGGVDMGVRNFSWDAHAEHRSVGMLVRRFGQPNVSFYSVKAGAAAHIFDLDAGFSANTDIRWGFGGVNGVPYGAFGYWQSAFDAAFWRGRESVTFNRSTCFMAGTFTTMLETDTHGNKVSEQPLFDDPTGEHGGMSWRSNVTTRFDGLKKWFLIGKSNWSDPNATTLWLEYYMSEHPMMVVYGESIVGPGAMTIAVTFRKYPYRDTTTSIDIVMHYISVGAKVSDRALITGSSTQVWSSFRGSALYVSKRGRAAVNISADGTAVADADPATRRVARQFGRAFGVPESEIKVHKVVVRFKPGQQSALHSVAMGTGTDPYAQDIWESAESGVPSALPAVAASVAVSVLALF
eukprot:m51a1_g3024 hypothetical protein (366) ;mRNA; r:875901-877168